MHLDLGITVALFLCPPSGSDAAVIDQLLCDDGVIVTAGYFPRLNHDLPNRSILRLDPSHAYRGQVARWTAISAMVSSAQPRMVVVE
jgi:hypothetical protein